MKQLMDMNFAKLRDKAGIAERWGLWITPPQAWERVILQEFHAELEIHRFSNSKD